MLENTAVLAVTRVVQAGGGVDAQLLIGDQRAETQAGIGFQVLFHYIQHGRDLLLGGNARQNRPAKAVQEVGAVHIRVGRQAVAGGTQIGVTALTVIIDEGTGEEVGLPGVLLHGGQLAGGHGLSLGDLHGVLFGIEVSQHLGGSVGSDLQQAGVHRAFGISVFQRGTPGLAALGELLAVQCLFGGAFAHDLIQSQRVVPVGLIQQRHAVLANGNLAAVLEDCHQRFGQRALGVLASDGQFFLEERVIPGQRAVAVHRLCQPELVIGAVARLLAFPGKIVVGVAHAEHIDRPAGNKFLG